MRWYFCQAHFMLFIFNQNKFCKPEQREDNSHNLSMGQSKFSYKLTFWFISIVNIGNLKSKNTLRVELDQFRDG